MRRLIPVSANVVILAVILGSGFCFLSFFLYFSGQVLIQIISLSLLVVAETGLAIFGFALLIRKFGIRQIPDQHAAIITKLGGQIQLVLAGSVFVWPFLESCNFHSMRLHTLAVKHECVTQDNIKLTYQFVVEWEENFDFLRTLIKEGWDGNEVVTRFVEAQATLETNRRPLDLIMSASTAISSQVFRRLVMLVDGPKLYGFDVRSVTITKLELPNSLNELYAARKQMQIQRELAQSAGMEDAHRLEEFNRVAAHVHSRTLEHLQKMETAKSGMLDANVNIKHD